MRVICIDDSWEDPKMEGYEGANEIKFGQIVTICKDFYDRIMKCRCYEFVEYPDSFYEASAFIPLSEIDETEFERQSLMDKVKY